LAAWINYGYEGYPAQALAGFIQCFMRSLLLKTLRDGMNPSVRRPGIKSGTTGTEMMETGAAIEKFRRSLTRLSSREGDTFHSPAFGEISHDDRVDLTLRHAELHLSFLTND